MTNDKRKVPELRFPGFKNEWEEGLVGDNFTFKNGINKGKEYFGHGIPIINFKDVYNNRAIYFDNLEGRVEASLSEIKNFSVRQGDVFFTRTSEVIEEIGLPAVAMSDMGSTVFSGFVLRARPKDNCNLSSDLFKKYVFITNLFRKEMMIKSSMTTRALTSGQAISNMKYMYPKQHKEQHILGNFFSKLDHLIELEEKKLELLELQKKGYMQQIFSQKLRFKDENGNDYPEWEEKKLSDVALTYSGGTPSSINKSFYNGTIPFIRSGEIGEISTELKISEKALQNSSAKMIKEGDILYALYGATSGEVAISKIDGAINQAILCIRTDEYPSYLYYYLKYKKNHIIKTFLQGGQGNLSAKIIKSILIILPSLEEQAYIGNLLSKVDNLINLKEKK
ncbi:restriction endonuclease subunit S, partial [Staphylococcus massiliensis CCUG 55927]